MKALLCILLLLVAIAAMTPTTAATRRYSVIGKPTISASHMNNILCHAGSTACGTGQLLYEDGRKSGVDPIFALAFFDHESTYGTQGIARLTLSLGNIRCSPGYSCISGYRAYGSWEQGYLDWYRLIRYYVDVMHLATIEQIVPTYAPASENDIADYISAVEQDVNTWRSEVKLADLTVL